MTAISNGTFTERLFTPADFPDLDPGPEPGDPGPVAADLRPEEAGEVRRMTRSDVLRAAIRSAAMLEPQLGSTYLVKNWIDRGTFSVVYGEPGVGKSFFAQDLACHVAAACAWHGVRIAGGVGPVLYVAGEGGGGLANRFVAWARAYPDRWAIARGRLYVLPLQVDFCGSDDALRLVEALDGLCPSLAVVDTLARSMGTGDENAPADMGAFVRNVGILREATGAHVMAVHHCGKDTSRGARGHSSLRGAVDTEVELTRADGVVTAETRKQRDMPTGEKFTYRLRQFELGKDGDGDSVTTCVVEPLGSAESSLRASRQAETRLGERQRDALEALRDAAAKVGRQISNSPDYPPNRRMVTEEQWREEFYRRAFADSDSADTRRKAFQRARHDLHAKGLVGQYNGYFWTVN